MVQAKKCFFFFFFNITTDISRNEKGRYVYRMGQP